MKKKGIKRNLIIGISAILIIPTSTLFAADYSQYDTIDKNNLNNILTIDGSSPGEQLGTEILTGDFDNDGKIDIVSSSPFFSSDEKDWRGKVTVYWGDNINNQNYSEIIGEKKGDQFGTALSKADLNDDGFEDLVIGAYQSDFKDIKLAGKVYVFWGNKEFKANTKINAADADIIYRGEEKNERLGLAISAGDINGDNVDDLLISAPGSLSGKAKVYGILGNHKYPQNHIYDIKKDCSLVIKGEAKELFGSSLAIGDINGDGIGDIAIGAYLANDHKKGQPGKVYLIKGILFSKAANKKLEYDLLKYPRLAKVLTGKQSSEWFGFSVKIHNVNKDSFNDIVIGSFMYLFQNKTGKISVYHGKRDFFEKNNDINKSIEIIGDNSQNLIGASVDFGDINKDGNEELILGAPGISTAESNEPGVIHIIPNAQNLSSLDYRLPKTPENRLILGDRSDDWFGAGLRISDINLDGSDDIVVGSPNYDNDKGYDCGRITIIYGNQSLILDQDFVRKNDLISRGEALKKIFENLNIENRNKEYLKSCNNNLEFCLFTFAIQSNYDQLSIGDLDLYPDVPKESQYYEYVNMATMLNLVHGYFKDNNSPFRPEYPLKRIQALKIILGSMDAIEWKYKFELEDEASLVKSHFDDVSIDLNGNEWWYYRYIDFAVKNNIIQPGGNFRPNDEISIGEFDILLENAKNYLNESSNSN